MKIFVVFSLCIAVVWAGCENLAKREACNRPEGDCSCQAGLSCVLTKKMILDGTAIPVKQCMPEGMEIDVETVDIDNDEQTSPAFRAKRFLGILTRCSSGDDCAPNFCCPVIVQRCLPKILENGACNFNNLHKCGCMDGLVCQKTTDIAIFPGISVPLEQCIKIDVNVQLKVVHVDRVVRLKRKTTVTSQDTIKRGSGKPKIRPVGVFVEKVLNRTSGWQ